MVSPLRAVVIGAGHQGNYHAQKLAKLDGVQLLAVCDADLARAQQVAQANATQAQADYRELIGQIDVAVVATPTESHFAIATQLLSAGVHVLLEKPMTRDVAEARELCRLAAQAKLTLQVGQSERFNPAVRAARAQLSAVPRYVEAHRLSPFRPRGLDVDVVLDLMIHDIDLLLSFVAAEVHQVHAVGSQVLTNEVDIANARIEFANGSVATLTASRVSTKPMRKLRMFAPNLYVSIDCLNHTLQIARKNTAAEPPIAVAEQTFEKPDSLLEQARAFVTSVRAAQPPVVSGEDGARALQVALAIRAQLDQARQNA